VSAPHPDLACRRVVEMVTDYLEGRLDTEAQMQLEQHLVLCDACVTFIEQNRALVSALRALAPRTAQPEARQAALRAFRKLHGSDEK
jgi:anti-sigma factor RsiW